MVKRPSITFAYGRTSSIIDDAIMWRLGATTTFAATRFTRAARPLQATRRVSTRSHYATTAIAKKPPPTAGSGADAAATANLIDPQGYLDEELESARVFISPSKVRRPTSSFPLCRWPHDPIRWVRPLSRPKVFATLRREAKADGVTRLPRVARADTESM